MGDVVKSVGNVVSGVSKSVGLGGLTGNMGLDVTGALMGSNGGNMLGALTGQNATDAAIAAQTKGMNSANTALNSTYQNQMKLQDPYHKQGLTALETLGGGQSSIMKDWQQDPGYQFQLEQGQNAINNSMAARGLGNSGAALKSLTNYSQGLASQEYDKVYNRNVGNLNTLLGAGQTATNNMTSATGAYGSNLSNNYMGLGNANAAAQIAQGNNMNNLIGQGMGIGAMAMFSDERLKTDVRVISADLIKEFRSKLRPYLFSYIEKSFGEGEWAGVMAQDLEKSELGRLLVFEDSAGHKQIDIKKTISLLLALEAEAA